MLPKALKTFDPAVFLVIKTCAIAVECSAIPKAPLATQRLGLSISRMQECHRVALIINTYRETLDGISSSVAADAQ